MWGVVAVIRVVGLYDKTARLSTEFQRRRFGWLRGSLVRRRSWGLEKSDLDLGRRAVPARWTLLGGLGSKGRFGRYGLTP